MAKKPSPRPSQQAKPYLSATDVADLGPADRIAREIVTARRDLLPSVERIMTAELDGDATHRAMALFQVSLSTPGDPNRDPRVAITAAASPSTTSLDATG